jgi:hypothetical protein
MLKKIVVVGFVALSALVVSGCASLMGNYGDEQNLPGTFRYTVNTDGSVIIDVRTYKNAPAFTIEKTEGQVERVQVVPKSLDLEQLRGLVDLVQ